MAPTDTPPVLDRRRLLAALAAGTTTSALAGCLTGGGGDATTADGTGGSGGGGDGDGSDGGSGNGGSGDGTTAADEPTGTAPPPDHVVPADEFDCEGMADGATARYDDPGDRFVFTFAHPESWFVRARDSPSETGVVVNAPAELSTGGYLFFVEVSQYYQPVAADAVESIGDYDAAGTLTYDGKDCWVGEMNAGDPGRVVQSVVVPDGTGTYRQVSVDTQNLSFEESCFDDARAVGEGVLQSLQPK